MLRPLLLGVVTVGFVTVAQAEPRDEATSQFPPGTVLNSGGRLMVVTPPSQFNSSPPFEVSNILYLNRCTGGCMVTGSRDINDAKRHIATYIEEGPHVVAEFENDAHQSGAAADADWAAVVQCMKEVYSPFNIQIVETPPAAGNYTEAIIAGHPTDVGLDGTILGVAPAHSSCEPNDNAMSFSFANYEGGTGLFRIYGICWTAAQESAHHYGLDHSYVFADGTSACNDPLTYRNDCGGQKFFRNQSAKCGEMQERACLCGGPQNSHAKIKNIFGAGQNIVPAPTATITAPTMGTIGQAQIVNGMAGSKRGVARVELWINNYKWAEVKGAKFGGGGQPNPAPYQIPIPATVPNGVMDIQLKAFDDLGELGTSSTVTVTKGTPCAAADTCATGQKCEAGKCFWEAPTGVLGDECTYAQACVSGLCQGTDELQICTQECIVGATDSCPAEYDCLPAGAQGICYPKDTGGGCCSVGSSDSVWVHVGFAGLILGLVTRRRRKR